MIKNPVMFVVEIGFLITLLLTIVPGLFGEGDTGLRTYNLIVSIILLVTVRLLTLRSLWQRGGARRRLPA